ncbi:phosphotransferase-like protein [Variovorax sp. DT-64]|uniref:phosphotransferase-like protein n=1 Tax=Variovorax sp. DT-64 TaxID=3396160 RepID=UPI003F1B6221
MQPSAIVLHGPTSAGKSSIAAALQDCAPVPSFHVTLDAFVTMSRRRDMRSPDEQRRAYRIHCENLQSTLRRLVDTDFEIILDTVLRDEAELQECVDVLSARPLCLVGIQAPLDTLEHREALREDRASGMLGSSSGIRRLLGHTTWWSTRRVSGDVLVGEYLVSTQFPNMGASKMFEPFVAAKSTALVTQQADLDGDYNIARLTLTEGTGVNAPPSMSYRVGQIRVLGGGTKLLVCNETVTISRISTCAGTIATYTGIADAEGHWRFINDLDATDIRIFGVVPTGNQKILLESGSVLSNPSSHVFSVALPESNVWNAVTSRGGDMSGNWSKYDIGVSTLTATGFSFDGTSKSASLTLASAGGNAPLGLRHIVEPSSVSFGLQGTKLTVMIGGSSWYGGYLQLGLID